MTCETEFGGARLHCPDAELDVLFERDAELLRAFEDVLTADAAGEGFILHLLFDGGDVNFGDAARGFDVGDGGDKAGQFVAGVEYLFEGRDARDAAIVGVRENGAADLFIDATRGEDGFAVHGMVGGLGVDLPIEIVEESGEAPLVLVFAELAGIGGDAGFDGEGVFTEAFGFGEFADDFPSLITGEHADYCRAGPPLQTGFPEKP